MEYIDINNTMNSLSFKQNKIIEAEFNQLEVQEEIEFKRFEDKTKFSLPNRNEQFHYINFEKSKEPISNCVFRDKVVIRTLYGSLTFENCRFEKSLEISLDESKDIDLSLFKLSFDDCFIEELNINNQHFKLNFYINSDKEDKNIIKTLNIKNSIFEQDFCIYNSEIEKIEIHDCDFNSLSEFNNVTFKNEFQFHEISYKGLTLFDKCTFECYADFEYIIFEKFTSFRGTKFNKGLVLDYTSSDNEINFFDIVVKDDILENKKTTRETYRIIKNQFEKIGNKIEANKYHALELDKRRQELETETPRNWKDWIVFKIHDLSSEHSTNWVRTLLWICFVGFATILSVHFDIAKDLFFHPNHFKFEYLLKIWIEFWQYVNITNVDKLKDSPFILFLNKVSLGYLYYQFLTAVRKDTRK